MPMLAVCSLEKVHCFRSPGTIFHRNKAQQGSIELGCTISWLSATSVGPAGDASGRARLL